MYRWKRCSVNHLRDGTCRSHIPELDVTWVSSIGQVKGFAKEDRALPWWALLKECVVVYGRE